MRLVRTVADLRAALDPARVSGSSIGLVPTMGALHEGHMALIRAARAENELVVVSIFVNPAQFGPSEDLARYPRDEARDAALADLEGVDLLFVPTPAEIYPDGFDTWVEPGSLAAILEGEMRPGHFRGVATVCTKLFGMVRPTRAYFGRKDAQQLAIILRLVADLDLGLEIRPVETVRDPDGLALSSRNVFLSPEAREHALALPRALHAGVDAHAAGAEAVAAARAILDAEPDLTVDYVALADFDGATLAAAVRVGGVRLIDNVRL